MAIDPKYIELLYRAQDTVLSVEEEKQLNQALAHSAELRVERDKLYRLRTSLKGMQPDASIGFTQRVMDSIYERNLPQLWLRRVAAACMLLIAGALLGLYLSEGSLSAETLIGLEELQPEDAVTLSGVFSIN